MQANFYKSHNLPTQYSKEKETIYTVVTAWNPHVSSPTWPFLICSMKYKLLYSSPSAYWIQHLDSPLNPAKSWTQKILILGSKLRALRNAKDSGAQGKKKKAKIIFQRGIIPSTQFEIPVPMEHLLFYSLWYIQDKSQTEQRRGLLIPEVLCLSPSKQGRHNKQNIAESPISGQPSQIHWNPHSCCKAEQELTYHLCFSSLCF